MRRLSILPALALSLALAAPGLAQSGSGDWQRYVDSTYGFSAELPLGLFQDADSGGRPGITLREIGGAAMINLYGGPAVGLTRDALEARLESGEQISTITYRAGGESWFVLSGFYEPTDADDDVIFYTKVLFSPDRDSFSAFEISFPEADKPRLEDLVERFEDNFTRPTR